jgi:predicted N-acyltransferase
MDMLSNPGFAVQPEKAGDIFTAMADFMRQHTLQTVITDYRENANYYPRAAVLPFMPHGLVATAGMKNLQDYIGEHKNIRKKLNSFTNHGGSIEIVRGALDESTLAAMKRCFLATADKSAVYLPYEELYLESAITISSLPADFVYHFIARKDGEFLGYQAAIKTGRRLNALHGALDRERETTFYAYDSLIVRMIEFAIQEDLESVDFGSILNITKQRMMNQSLDMNYYLFSQSALVQRVLAGFFKLTKSQGKEQMKFARPVGN